MLKRRQGGPVLHLLPVAKQKPKPRRRPGRKMER